MRRINLLIKIEQTLIDFLWSDCCLVAKQLGIVFKLALALVTGQVIMLILIFLPMFDTQCQLWAFKQGLELALPVFRKVIFYQEYFK